MARTSLAVAALPCSRTEAIVCGVSTDAAYVAIALARRERRRVIACGAPAPLLALGDVEIETRPNDRVSATTLLSTARDEEAALLVVAANGRMGRGPLRSLPVRLAWRATAPVLVVREAGALRRWLDGESMLRVMVAIDRSPASSAALEWAHAFTNDLPAEIAAAGLDPPMKPRDWDAANAVREIATRWRADLLVLGTARAGRLTRWWRRSATERLIDEAPMSVAAVPCLPPL
jgi:nucleotide-binding universal stress UspA family protein